MNNYEIALYKYTKIFHSAKTFLYFCFMAKIKRPTEIDFIVNPTQQGMILSALLDVHYATGLSIIEILLLLHIFDVKKTGKTITVNGEKYSIKRLYDLDYLKFIGSGVYVITKKTVWVKKMFDEKILNKERFVDKKSLTLENKIKKLFAD